MKMKKLQILGIALVAVFAFGVLVAASASAAPTFLLAEWLVNGVAIPEGTELATESTGTLELEDLKTLLGVSVVKCKGIMDGKVGFDGADTIAEVLNAAKELIGSLSSGIALVCEEAGEKVCKEPLVWPLNLPWNTLLELMEQGTEIFFADLILAGASGNPPGWEVECMKTFTTPVDQCTGEGITKLGLEATTLTASFEEAFRELAEVKLALCTQSNEESGHVLSVGTGTIKLATGTETLSASSESSEA
jgi:hypothetical protein